MNELVLIIPPSPWLISDTDIPNLGILYVSAYIKRFGYKVKVCDLNGIEEKNWKIPEGNIYGITGTSPQFIYIKKIINLIKRKQPESLIVVGGVHATVLPEHILNNTKADICVIGEGEITMLDIMRNKWLQYIDGIVYKSESSIIKNNSRTFIDDLDLIPLPDREAIDFHKYIQPKTFKYVKNCPETIIMASRGCCYDCKFCASNQIWQRKVRYHSINRVIQEIKYLKNKYNIGLIYFDDDTFVLNKKRVIELCEQLKKINIKWHCLNRVDCCDLDILKLMKDSGCLQIVFGFETGSNKLLEIVNKRTTVEQSYEAINNVKNVGMKIRGQMMVGLPGETDETVEETANFIRKAKKVDTFGMHVFQPVPGCDIWNNPEKYNYKLNKNTDFSTYHTIGKPGDKLTNNQKVNKWFKYLKQIISNRNIELKGAMDG